MVRFLWLLLLPGCAQFAFAAEGDLRPDVSAERASAFSPLAITGLEVWLRSDRGVFTDSGCTETADEDGDPVGCWEDQASGLTFIQATASEQATLQLDELNGHPMIDWDGTDDQLQGDGPANVGISVTYLTVFKESASCLIYETHDAGTVNTGDYLFSTTNNSSNFERPSNVISSLNADAGASWLRDNTFRVVTQRINGGDHDTHEVRFNGTTQAMSVGVSGGNDLVNSNTNQKITFGRRHGDTLPCTGAMVEFIFVDAYVPDAQLALLETYLTDRYAL